MFRTLCVVFRKEMRDLMRDRRALFFLFAVPLLMPLVAFVGLLLVGWQVMRQAPEGLTVAVDGADHAPALVRRLDANDLLHRIEPPDDPRADLRSGELMAWLMIPPDAQSRLAAEQTVTVTLTTSRVGWMPSLADMTIRDLVTDYNRDLLRDRLAERGLDPAWTEPLHLAQAEAPTVGIVAPPSEVSGTPLGRSFNGLMTPFLVASWSMGGSLGLLVYMTVGEKERGTMEPLLITTASRVGIVLGKISLAMIVSFITVVIWAAYGLGYLMLVNLTADLGVGPPPTMAVQAQAFGIAGVWIVILMIPFMVLTSGVVAAVGTFARNYREAGLFTAVLQLGLPVLSFAAVFLAPATPSVFVYALPFVGTLVAVRDLFLQGLQPTMLALTVVASVLYAALSILLAAYVFSREWALMRGL
jgi:sodium transport system permease protein